MHTMLSPHHTSTHTQALQWPRPGPVCIQCSAPIIHLHTHRPYSDQGPVPYAYNAQPASYIYTHTGLTVTKARSRMHTMLSPHHTSTHTQALQWPRPGPVCIQCSARIIHLHTHRPYSDQGPVPYAYNAQPASYIYTHTGLTVTKARSRMHTMLSPHHTSTHTQALQWPRPGPVCIQCSARIIHLHTHRPYSDQGPVPYAYNAQPASYIYTHTGLTVTKARSRMHTMLSPHHTSTHTQALQWPRPGPVCIQCSARIIHLHTHRPYSDQGPVPYAYNAQPASYIYTHTGLTVTKARSRMHTMLSPHHTSTHTQTLQWPRPGPVCIQCSARIIHLHTHRPYSDQGPVPYAYNAQPASYIYTHTGLTVTKARSRMHTMLSPHHTSTHTQALQWPRPGPVCIQCSARIIHLHTHRPYSDQGPVPYAYNAQPASYIYTHTGLTVTKARSRMHTMLSPHHTSTHTQALQWPRPGPVCIQCSARIIHLHTHRPYSDQGPVPYAYNAQPASYIYTHTGLTVTKARSRMHTMLSPHHTSTHTHRPYSDQGPVPYAYNAQPASYIYTHTGLTVTKARSRMHTMLSPHHTSTHTQALQWPRPGPVCIQCSARIIHLHTHTGLTVTKARSRMHTMLSPHHTSTHTHRPYSDQGPVPYAYNAQPASYIYTHTGLTVTKARSRMHTMLSPHHTSTHTQALQWPRPGPVCIQCSARIIHLHTHRPYSDQGPVPYAYNAQPASYIYTHTGLTVTKARSRMHTMLSPHHTSTHTHRPYSDQGPVPYAYNAQPASYIYTHTQALQWPRPGPVCIQCSARIIHLHTHRPYSDQGPVPYAYNAQPASYIYTHTGLTVTKARSRMHTMLSPHHTSTHTQALQWPRPGPVCIQCSARIIHLHTHTGLTVTKARSRMHTMLSPHHTSTHTHRPYSDQGPVPYAYNAQPASYIYTHTGLTVTKARSRMHTMLSPHHTSTHTQALQWPRPGPVCIQCSARIIHLHTHRPYSDQGPVPYAYNAQPASYIYTHTGLTVTKARSRMHTMLSPHHTSTHTHRPYSDQGPVPYAYNAQPASYIYTHTDAARSPRVMQTCHSGEALAVLPLSCSSSL